MSFRKAIKRVGRAVGAVARAAAPVAAIVPGVGTAVAAGLAVAGQIGARSPKAEVLSGPTPATAGANPMSFGRITMAAAPAAVPALGPLFGGLRSMAGRLIPGAVGAGAAVAVRSAAAIGRGAVAWCRRNPVWCSQIGGTAAIAAMIERGELPMPRRRRGRGLTARDLRSFRRTVRVMRGVAQSVGLRGGRGRKGAAAGGTIIAQN